jgi:hypothetical protein
MHEYATHKEFITHLSDPSQSNASALGTPFTISAGGPTYTHTLYTSGGGNDRMVLDVNFRRGYPHTVTSILHHTPVLMAIMLEIVVLSHTGFEQQHMVCITPNKQSSAMVSPRMVVNVLEFGVNRITCRIVATESLDWHTWLPVNPTMTYFGLPTSVATTLLQASTGNCAKNRVGSIVEGNAEYGADRARPYYFDTKEVYVAWLGTYSITSGYTARQSPQIYINKVRCRIECTHCLAKYNTMSEYLKCCGLDVDQSKVYKCSYNHINANVRKSLQTGSLGDLLETCHIPRG